MDNASGIKIQNTIEVTLETKDINIEWLKVNSDLYWVPVMIDVFV